MYRPIKERKSESWFYLAASYDRFVVSRAALAPDFANLKKDLLQSVDPDHTQQNAVSDQGLHCLH